MSKLPSSKHSKCHCNYHTETKTLQYIVSKFAVYSNIAVGSFSPQAAILTKVRGDAQLVNENISNSFNDSFFRLNFNLPLLKHRKWFRIRIIHVSLEQIFNRDVFKKCIETNFENRGQIAH